MKADDTYFLRFLQTDQQLIVPMYQRNYSWNITQCRQLWRDIYNLAKKGKAEHFLGSIVFISESVHLPGAINRVLLIDGQQRIASIILLLHILGKIVEEKNLSFISKEKIYNYYIFNQNETGELRYKLILAKKDNEIFRNLLNNIKVLDYGEDKNLSNAYDFFYNTINMSKIDLERIFNSIQKLSVVIIALKQGIDKPQMIFESLNSRGLDLTENDLIRNYILMDLELSQQEKIYNAYWYPMERNFQGEDPVKFDRFFRDYLTLKTLTIPKLNEIFNDFKEFTEDEFSYNKNIIEELAADLLKFSNYYAKIAFLKEKDKELKNKFEYLKQLDVKVVYPFLLGIYDDYENKVITKEDFLTVLNYIESYVFRRSICGVPTNSLNKTFLIMIQDIDKKNIVDSLKIFLTKWKKYRRFPTDVEFKNELLIKDVYRFGNSKYLLDKLENFERKEKVNIDDYTIEHIMPQKEDLTDQWRKELGSNWKEIHENFLHTLGNLTITGYNSKYGYKPYLEKRNMEGGFGESPFKLNKMLGNLDKWNDIEINKRGTFLTEIALKVWPFPEVPKEILDKFQAKGADEADDEADIKTDYVSEDYWKKRASLKSLEIMNRFIEIAMELNENLAITYNKNHIALKTSKRNFIWFHPRMGNYNYIGIRFNLESATDIKNKLEELKLLRKEDTTERYTIFYIPIEEVHIEKNKNSLKKIINQAIADSS